MSKPEQYIIIAAMHDRQDTVDRAQAEQFLSAFYNPFGVQRALDNARDFGEIIRLSEGYVIRSKHQARVRQTA